MAVESKSAMKWWMEINCPGTALGSIMGEKLFLFLIFLDFFLSMCNLGNWLFIYLGCLMSSSRETMLIYFRLQPFLLILSIILLSTVDEVNDLTIIIVKCVILVVILKSFTYAFINRMICYQTSRRLTYIFFSIVKLRKIIHNIIWLL